MEATKSFAASRIRERLFVMWQEADGDPGTAYQLWHKVRPLLKGQKVMAAAPEPGKRASSSGGRSGRS